MLQSDAELLRLIADSGGIPVVTERGDFVAIFDNEFVESAGGVGIEGQQPVLTCRSSDIERVGLNKSAIVTVIAQPYRVQRIEPDGDGISRVILRK